MRLSVVCTASLIVSAHGQDNFLAPTYIVRVHSIDIQGRSLGDSVACVLDEHHALSTCHGIQGASSVTLITKAQSVMVEGVVSENIPADIAVLKVRSFDPPYLKVAETPPKAGDEVTCYRLGPSGDPVASRGRVISCRQDIWFGEQIETSCIGSPGDSGAPLVDCHGRLLGIVTNLTNREGKTVVCATPVGAVSYAAKSQTATALAEWNAAHGWENWTACSRAFDAARDDLLGDRRVSAAAGFRQVVDTCSSHQIGWYNLAIIQLQEKNTETLSATLEEWEHHGGPAQIVWLLRGVAAYGERHYDRALVATKKSFELKPSVHAKQIEGDIYRATGEVAQAAAAYAQATQLDPGNPDPWRRLYVLWWGTKAYHEAKAAAEHWSQLEYCVDSLVAYGAALHYCDDRDGALVVLRKAVANWPESVSALAQLGWALSEQKSWREALEVLSQAWNLRPGEARVGVNYAKVLLELDRPREALDILQRTDARTTANASRLAMMVEAARRAGDEKTATSADNELRRIKEKP